MGIKIQNLDHALLELTDPGTLAAATDQDAVVIPFDGWIINITARLGTAATDTFDTILDLHLAGTTIFSGAGKLTFIATTGVTATVAALTSDPVPVTNGQILSLDCDQIATDPKMAVVNVLVSKRPISEVQNLFDLNSVF